MGSFKIGAAARKISGGVVTFDGRGLQCRSCLLEISAVTRKIGGPGIAFDRRGLEITRLAIGDFGGAAVTVKGRIDTRTQTPRGAVTLDLDARRLDGVATLIEKFPHAWLEDPDVTAETRPLLDPVSERVTWDAPIHSIADIEAMPWSPPKTVNVKPSRFGPIRNLFAAYDYCEERGIGAYGGGQTELGQGRGQIQYLASIFHPDTPNDVAPGGYNDPEQATKPGLPSSPLQPAIEPTGFRWRI